MFERIQAMFCYAPLEMNLVFIPVVMSSSDQSKCGHFLPSVPDSSETQIAMFASCPDHEDRARPSAACWLSFMAKGKMASAVFFIGAKRCNVKFARVK